MRPFDSPIEACEAPALLTIDESATVLRIGRSHAYQLARDYLSSGGVTGLPVIRLGSCLRVPRWALIELATTGRVVRLCDEPEPRTTLTRIPKHNRV